MTKAFTDIIQSRKLAEILPVESADMRYAPFSDIHPWVWADNLLEKGAIPCWSLAALLDILDKTAYLINENASVNLFSYKTIKWTICIDNCGVILITEANPIDACVKMILKLHELNLL